MTADDMFTVWLITASTIELVRGALAAAQAGDAHRVLAVEHELAYRNAAS